MACATRRISWPVVAARRGKAECFLQRHVGARFEVRHSSGPGDAMPLLFLL
jgi:hypothetical protein